MNYVMMTSLINISFPACFASTTLPPELLVRIEEIRPHYGRVKVVNGADGAV